MTEEVPSLLASAPRLGLFGGTFDPVHVGHLHVARRAREHAALDAVVFVPAARSPHKDDGTVASGADRLAMLERAVADDPAFVVWDLELLRGAPSYTVETVRELVRLRGGAAGLYLVLGSDNLVALDRWAEIETILELAAPIVVERRGAGPGLVDRLELAPELLECLRAGFVAGEPVDAAATDLRQRLAEGGGRDEVPAAVWEYARASGIYGGGMGQQHDEGTER